MRTIRASIFFIVATVSLSSVSAQSRRFAFSEDKLLGPVHTVQVENGRIIIVDGKEIDVARKPHQKVVYDRRGNEIERINFDEGGAVTNRTVQLIDAQGRSGGWESYEAQGDGKGERLKNRSEFLYDERGNRVEIRIYRNGELTQRTTTSYDAAGNVLEEVMVTDGGSYKQTKKNSFDADGRLTKTVFDTNGRVGVSEYSYNAVGNKVGYKHSHSDGRNNQASKYVYDSRGKEIEHSSEDSISTFKMVITYDSRGRVSRQETFFEYKKPNISRSHAPEPGVEVFRYNERDQIVEESFYLPGGALRQRVVYEYDSDGRLRSCVNFNGGGEEIGKVIHEYDKWGNRVRTLNFGRGLFDKPEISVTHRIITYY